MDKVSEIWKAVDGLSLKEAKLALKHILLQANLAKSDEGIKAQLYDNLTKLYDELMTPKLEILVQEPDSDAKRVHIVFGESMAGSLKQAFKGMGLVNTDVVTAILDLLSIGPITHLHEETGHEQRYQWFSDHINLGDSMDGSEFGEYCRESLREIANIPDQAEVMIWSSSNALEQVGLRFAAYLLRDKPNRVYVCNPAELCSRRYNTENYRIDYMHSGEIPAEKLQAVYEEAVASPALSTELRQDLEQEWLSLAQQTEVLRIWIDGQIRPVDAAYFDDYILKTTEGLHHSRGNGDFIKAARVIGEAYGHCDQYIGDIYFEYRLRHLIYRGELEIKGLPKAMRYYSVRRRV
ncbi:DUF1835 domain-containing protein [Paenibacillus sp. NPDC058177]|uniref:DUF1835 domain-containing protein n=1 Tax=Paenibacillus sp. NPDC058177 TaxID=3346369 RepID=UPI0036DE236A